MTERLKRGIPLLGQGGVDATSIKCCEASFVGADGGGWFDYRLFVGLNEPPRLRRLVRLRDI
jgi:hypothetical protein